MKELRHSSILNYISSVYRPFSDRPFSDRPFSDRPFSDRPFSDRPFSDRPFSDRPFSDSVGLSVVNHMHGMQYQIALNIAFCPELN